MNIPDHDWQLEAPYQRMCDEAEKFEHWLERFEDELRDTFGEGMDENELEHYREEDFVDWAWQKFVRETGL